MPKINFTTNRLRVLSCPAGVDRTYYHDARTLGLALCVTRTGVKVFYVYRRVNGKPARIRLGLFPHELSVDGARKEAAKVNGSIARGDDPRHAKRAARGEATFGQLFADFIAEKRAKKKARTCNEYQRQYERYLLKPWRTRRASEIDRAEVERLHVKLGRENGKYLANRVLALVHAVFRKGRRDMPNPASGIEKFAEKHKERFLQPDEMPAFFKALEAEPPIFGDFFALALFTGQRRSNVQAMRWADLNLDRAEWRIPGETMKNGEPLTLPLSPHAVAILRRRQAESNGSEFVFASHGKSGHLEEPKFAWQRITDRAGLAGMRVHDLRHSNASWQVRENVPLPVIARNLGHKTLQTTMKYAHASRDAVTAAVNGTSAAMVAAGRKVKP